MAWGKLKATGHPETKPEDPFVALVSTVNPDAVTPEISHSSTMEMTATQIRSGKNPSRLPVSSHWYPVLDFRVDFQDWVFGSDVNGNDNHHHQCDSLVDDLTRSRL